VLQPGHAPVHFTQGYWITQGIGKVAWADRNCAIAIDGDRISLLTPQRHQARILAADGSVIAEGPVGPHTALVGSGDSSQLVIELDGSQVLSQTFPLDRPEPSKETETPERITAILNSLAGPNPHRIEAESFGANEGTPNALSAPAEAAKISADSDPVLAISLARACYRIGVLDQVARISALFPGPDADLLTGLLAMEAGESTDFGSAGWQVDWLRALNFRADGKPDQAIAAVDRYLAEVPDAWYPRLARAAWAKDASAATKLAMENPASPEAQLVLEFLGLAGESKRLLAGNPDAEAHLNRFRAMVETGAWAPMTRFK
jgi:hypothetical protein